MTLAILGLDSAGKTTTTKAFLGGLYLKMLFRTDDLLLPVFEKHKFCDRTKQPVIGSNSIVVHIFL